VKSLREVKASDKGMIHKWRNLPEVAKYMYTDHYITEEEHETWFNQMLSNPRTRYWVIVCDGEDVGLVNLYNIDEKNQRCYWAFYLASENVRGKGIGSFVEFSIFRYVFENLKFNKLCCEVLSFNQAVTDMHKSFGFKEEGLFKKHIKKGDEFLDVVCLAILREEWQTQKDGLEARLTARGVL
jgi:UDP-4-amino-4,6-dideoxy-N-acetyl-beta-L-altrosamine N-acetyltransferase